MFAKNVFAICSCYIFLKFFSAFVFRFCTRIPYFFLTFSGSIIWTTILFFFSKYCTAAKKRNCDKVKYNFFHIVNIIKCLIGLSLLKMRVTNIIFYSFYFLLYGIIWLWKCKICFKPTAIHHIIIGNSVYFSPN